MQKMAIMLGLGLALAIPARADLSGAMAAYSRQDYASAQRQLQELAQQGEPTAQLHLGRLYEEGRGVGQDYAEAARWYGLASDAGNLPARYSLGSLYFQGRGVARNHTAALAPQLTAQELRSAEELAKRLSVPGAVSRLLQQPAASMAGR